VNNVREAKDIASNFVAQILDDKKNLVAESVSFSAYQKQIADNKAQEEALLREKEVVASNQLEANSIDSTVLERLQSIWPSASADEKKAFLVWVFQK